MHDIEVKTILSAKNGFNLYRGCTHGCIYCDSRSSVYGMDHEFEDIAVKANAPQLLEDALRRKRKPCMVATGAMCDPYMPCEKRKMLTRRSLEIIEKYRCGVSLLTKSDGVLRDIDLLERINSYARAVVQMTLTTADENLCRLVEPNVCTTKRRYEVLKECQKRNIPTMVWLCPILPYINDTAENLNGILDDCFDAGVKGILCFGFGVTLRQGNREYFYQKLDEHFPGIKQKYAADFGESYICSSKNEQELWRIFSSRCRKEGVMTSQDDIFRYLGTYPEQERQIGFFDEDMQ